MGNEFDEVLFNHRGVARCLGNGVTSVVTGTNVHNIV